MKYLLLICVDPSIEPDEEPGEIEAWLERLGDFAADRERAARAVQCVDHARPQA